MQATARYMLVVQYKEMSYPGVALLRLQYPVAANKIMQITLHMNYTKYEQIWTLNMAPGWLIKLSVAYSATNLHDKV